MILLNFILKMSWAPFIVCFLSLALVVAVILHETPKKSKEHKSILTPKKWHRNRRSISNQGKVWKRDLSDLSVDLNQFTSSVMIKLEKVDSRINELVDSINEIKINVKKLTENYKNIITTEIQMEEEIENKTNITTNEIEDMLENKTSTQATTNAASTLPSPIPCTSTSIREMHDENTSTTIEDIKCTLESDVIYDDCISATQNNQSGIYKIKWPFSCKPRQVYCDRQWLVIQRRYYGNQPFNKGWQSYKNGFGSSCKDFWIGNQVLHQLTSNNSWSVMVEFWNRNGNLIQSVVYKSFRIASEKKNFALYIDGFQSRNGKDGLSFHNGSQFVTSDRGLNDNSIRCSILEESGWWFAHTNYLHFTTCNHHLLGSNLNAPLIRNYEIKSKSLLYCINNSSRQWKTFKFSNSLYWRGETLQKGDFNQIQVKIKMN